ncbi:MAG: rod shape-determining protein MreD [Bacteroidales bacterium]|nr:rod shape-determining protein MreD [Bacteroidales bacterium]
MNNPVVKQVLRFILLLLLQVLVCNHVVLYGYINPNIYVLAILLLPLNVPKSVQYIIAFAAGFFVDAFIQTFGVHASASLMLVALRPYVMKLLEINKKGDYKGVPVPGKKDLKFMVVYTVILVFIHQLFVTMLEVFSFQGFFISLISILLNTLFTTVLVLCIQYIFTPEKKQ